MKLIKRGIDPKAVKRYAKCYNCKSEYEFLPSDPEVTLMHDMREGDYYTFICQVCNCPIYASARVPPEVT